MPDYSKLQPIIDKLGRPGEMTSEYKAMKAATTSARIMWGLGLLGMIAGSLAAAFGVQSKVGMIAGAVATACGAGMEILVNLGYSKAAADIKASGSDLAQVVMGPPAPSYPQTAAAPLGPQAT